MYYSGTGSYVVDNLSDLGGALEKVFTVEQGENYTLSFCLKLEDPTKNQFYLYRQCVGQTEPYSNTLQLDDHTYITPEKTSDWQFVQLDFTPSAFMNGYPYESSYGYIWLAPDTVPILLSSDAAETDNGHVLFTAVVDSRHMKQENMQFLVDGVQADASAYTATLTPSLVSDKCTVLIDYKGALSEGEHTF